jgi:hypothetical protein
VSFVVILAAAQTTGFTKTIADKHHPIAWLHMRTADDATEEVTAVTSASCTVARGRPNCFALGEVHQHHFGVTVLNIDPANKPLETA